MTHLFDTNVVSELRRPNRAHPRVVGFAAALPRDAVFISVITLHELERGARLAAARGGPLASMLRAWLDDHVHPTYAERSLPVTSSVAVAAAGYARLPTVELADQLIAATALVHGLTLVTRNVRHFAPMGVRLLNPWDA